MSRVSLVNLDLRRPDEPN